MRDLNNNFTDDTGDTGNWEKFAKRKGYATPQKAPSTKGRQYEELPSHRKSHYKRSSSSSKPRASPTPSLSSRSVMSEEEVEDLEEEDIYIVKQRYGYFSMLFSFVQTLVLVVMMFQCGVAPFNINPMIGPYPDALNYWGGKNALLIIEDGESWRLMTPILLHAGVIHLVCNVAVQLETGLFFEREWGSWVWLFIYLVSALGSSILSTCAMPNSISVGSSGAVMGLFGGKLAEVFCRSCESRKSTQQRIGHEVRMEQLSGVLCSVVLVALMSFIPYVDWAAHLGGCVAGLFSGMLIFSSTPKSCIWIALWAILGIVTTLIYFFLALQYMYSGEVEPAEDLRDVCGYYKEFFEDYECNCMKGEQD